ncbi:centrosome and spindle pole-associated protein 1 [Cololabis saira]|uniref:centrosome and spindle pole-associated protein 1 n=1 Tax=Cololabis saira TaxID=129043 RepID=UPI002AD410F1|nr:centrosome and spindle pole-associated protein 1 [Cololabis saira]
MAYNPWGRGGAGAPIQDQNGNIVCDLNQLRKINNCYMSSPGAETRTSFPHQLPAYRHRPLLQQHQIQNRYKEDLEKQIEEKKRKEAEERERLKIAEEEEERKVAEARARLCQDFEEERRIQNVNTVVSRKEPPLQQQQTKDRYKEDLKQQVGVQGCTSPDKTTSKSHAFTPTFF